MNRSMWRKFVAVAVVLLVGSAVGVLAQEETGNVYAKVHDTNGSPLPGVTCELSGLGAPKTQVSNAAGEVRWLSLDPGNWALRCSLEGFSTVEYPNISVRVARNVSIEVQLTEAIGEVITVTSESPLLDERQIATGTTITQVELESIPTARDPWSVLNQTPGVLVDRVNVGGNESGQQATFLGPGVSDDENSFLVDGVEVTDMAAIGASPGYWDFDQFTEMQFSTGGTDVTKGNAGVSVNLVTKRGSNEFRGSARFLRTDDSFFGWEDQEVPVFEAPDSVLGPGQAAFIGNSINQITEYGFEAGGPVLRDRLWFWGSFGTNDIKNRTGGATPDDVQPDDTILENTALKVNWQIASPNSFVGSWNNGDKKKFGRNASPTRPQPTTWDQRGPTAIIKFEDTHVFGSNFFLGGTWSKVDGGFSLTCKACVAAGSLAATTEAYLDENAVWQNSFFSGPSSRPSEEIKIDGSYFFNTGSTSHELKFGGRVRQFESESTFVWPGRNLYMVAPNIAGLPQGGSALGAARGDTPLVHHDYTSAWVQDTIQLGHFTINAGLRYDKQEGTNEAYVIEGNPAFPEILPDLTTGSFDAGFDWSDLTPRIGVTYALGEERKTLIRGNYSQFVQQLDTSTISWLNPLGYSLAYFEVQDNGVIGLWEPGIDEILDFLVCVGCTPGATSAVSPNQVDSGLTAPLTQEFTVGVEHSLIPEFVMGANLIWRNTSDVLPGTGFTASGGAYREILDLNGDGIADRPSQASDYAVDATLTGELFDGTPYSVPRYSIACDCITGGQLMENTTRESEYTGGSVYFTKRLANQWMMRGYFQYGDATWNVPGSYTSLYDPTNDELGGDIDGELVAIAAAGSGAKANVLIQSTWQWNLNGMYQVAPDRPWGFNVAANLFGREGYPNTQYRTTTGTDGVGNRIEVDSKVDQYRVDDLFTTDLRLEKEFSASGNVGFTFSIDIFNVFDEAYVMQRERRWNTGSYDYLRETLSPRIWRLGVRLNWR